MRIRAVRAVRRAFFMSGLTVLAACSGGGGGSIASNTPPPAVPNTPPPAPSPPPPPVSGPPPPIGVNIAAPAPATLGGNTHIQATAAAPNFSAATPPTPGTVFALNHTAMDISSTAAASVAIGPGTLTVNRVLAGGTADYRLTIPSLSIDVCCMTRSGSSETQADGGMATLFFSQLTYTMMGSWGFLPPGTNPGHFYRGAAVTGYQTPLAGRPASGTATYSGAGGVSGLALAQNRDGNVVFGSLRGNGNVTLNFDTLAVNGRLTGMTADGTPWNEVVLNGSLSGTSFSGGVTATSSPSGLTTYDMSNNATGDFSGAMFGPQGQEIGLVWTLRDSALGRSAIGVFGAAKQ
jgi:hypothetical protein